MSVIIEPAEQLEFHGPFTRISKESLHVKNPGLTPVIFKVKTTAPKQYCVRPNAGRIEPNSEIEVQIILQPFKEELPEDYKCKDKFLVQTAPIHESFEQQDITSMWTHVETLERATMHQHKIKCVFASQREEDKIGAPISETVNPIASSSSTTTSNAPTIVPAHTFTSDLSQSDIPVVPIHREEVAPPPTLPEPIPEHIPEPIAEPVSEPVSAPISEPISAPIEKPVTTTDTFSVNAVPTTRDIPATRDIPTTKEVPMTTQLDNSIQKEKNDELKEALEKIKRLEKELSELREEEGLRSRNNNNNNNGSRKLASTVQPLDAVHQHLAALEKPRADEGYPPQVVLLVAVLVFIFTYLFF